MNKKICPVCGSDDTRLDYETPDSMSACDQCGSEWITETREVTMNCRIIDRPDAYRLYSETEIVNNRIPLDFNIWTSKKNKYQVIAAITTYCYLDVEASSQKEARESTQDKLNEGLIDGGDFYTMEEEEYPGKFKIVKIIKRNI